MRQAGTEMSGSNGSPGVPGHTINQSNGLGSAQTSLIGKGREITGKDGGQCFVLSSTAG